VKESRKLARTFVGRNRYDSLCKLELGAWCMADTPHSAGMKLWRAGRGTETRLWWETALSVQLKPEDTSWEIPEAQPSEATPRVTKATVQ
jgi:hypothetical protein